MNHLTNSTLDCTFSPYLGSYQFFSGISTNDSNANDFFQQGITHAFGFNQVEALKSFACCLDLEPTNAMCNWGMSYGFGPFLNKPKAFYYSTLAESYLDLENYKPDEIALIKTTRLRFPDTTTPQSSSSKSYRDAMIDLITQPEFSNNADLLTMYAESEMDLSMSLGIDYYINSKQTTHGPATSSTSNAINALTKVMSPNLAPNHPMALHLFIHATEPLSPGSDASLGELSASALKNLDLKGSGHLSHMPGHLFLRVGRYNDVIQNNIKASSADDLYDLNGHVRVASFKTGDITSAQGHLETVESIMNCSNFQSKFKPRSTVALYTLTGLINDDIKMWEAAASEQNSWTYNSPPHWPLSTNTCLGTMYIQNEMWDSAIESFKNDLKEYPKNAWGLYGVYEGMKESGEFEDKEVEDVKREAEDAWVRGDEKLETSCRLLS
ncbi:hypothetical protein TL16_g10574 [Triparma laevis f. inornata]|uniref:Uncharacterized protein n=1 Tax=Triparma laevis f. inornata TaxID=1714386 RepID=A0A9W7B925_9STRA|nr:hypothetical protein TL16_g10574 [Triparma laevis f. inornata]